MAKEKNLVKNANTPEAIAKRQQREKKRVAKEKKEKEENLFFNHIYSYDSPENSWEALQQRERSFNIETQNFVTQAFEKNKNYLTPATSKTEYIKREAAKMWFSGLLKRIKQGEDESVVVDLRVAYFYYGKDDKLRYYCADVLIEGIASKIEKISETSIQILSERISLGNFGSTFWIRALSRDNIYPNEFWLLLVSYHIFAKANGSLGVISDYIAGYVKKNPEVNETWKRIGVNPLQIYQVL